VSHVLLTNRRFVGFLHISSVALSFFFAISAAHAQGAKLTSSDRPLNSTEGEHIRERDAWFYRGRIVRGKPSADLRRRAYHAKLQMRAQRARTASLAASAQAASSAGWTPLGPVPLASDASGSGVQDYRQVAGRATAIAIDPADPTGNTVYIGGAQAGIWKSTNAATSPASAVNWTPITDSQATLSIGSIAIQPLNNDPTKTLILVGTGEANNSADSYFGLGILRSADAGNTWMLISTANNGALSFGGLGGTRMAFSTANTVVAAMATTSEGLVDGEVTTSTARALYTSLDAGLSWTYNALLDPGNQPTDATSATFVTYNAGAGLFFAAVRYHGFYSSRDGVNWTRLPNQPGQAGALSTTNCPPQSTSNNRACPIYRGEITAMPGRNEMYVWYISLDPSGNPVDQFIWQSTNSGVTWTQINDNGITNCGDAIGCGVEQGYYNLALQAVPNGSTATDLYAGAVNLYKCSISSINPNCNTFGFMNLTHVYGCSPIAAPSHVHPDQHALAYTIPTSGNDLMYFANDGGIYRALDGFTFGMNSGSCSVVNRFDDLNQNLGSMTQVVSFSQHPSDPNTLLGGAQDNGSPATAAATTSTSWINVNGGDGGFNAIDQGAPLSWYVSNPDVAPGGLNILQCSSGPTCREGNFSAIVDSNSLGGDDGGFYFPYILDPQSRAALLVGTCRVWRGPRLGGSYTDLSPNFDTFGSGACTGGEVNLVRALAAGGPTDGNGSQVIYVTTDGLGPLNTTSPTGGHVWVTTNATAGTPAFSEVSQNINPNQFPVSGVAIDTSDATGGTAYVTIMGFTNGAGHVWKTTDAGATWSDFTGSDGGALPDAPVNAVVVDPGAAVVYVGTDVGVFQSTTAAANWIEVGPSSVGGQSGFLPNVAVTALGIFSSGSQKLLRASTYGRGMWQWNLAPDFQIAITNSPQTVFPGQSATFSGTVTALNGYTNSLTLACTAGATSPPSSCTPKPLVLTATVNTPFTVKASDAVGDYSFNVQGTGSDSAQTTHTAGLLLHVIDFGLTLPSPSTVITPPGTKSPPVSFQVTAAGSFNQSVSVSCTVSISGGGCSLTPATTVTPTASTPVNMTASVTVPVGTPLGSYTVNLQATTSGAPAPKTTSFTLTVEPDFSINSSTTSQSVAPGQTGSYNLTVQPVGASFDGAVSLSCPTGLPAGALCSFNPPGPVTPGTRTVGVAMTISTTSATPPGNYSITVTGTSGSLSHSVTVALVVKGFQLTVSQAFPANVGAGSQTIAQVRLTSTYTGSVNASCDASAFSGTCSVTPANPVAITSGVPIALTLTVTVPGTAAPNPSNLYNVNLTVVDSQGQPSHALPLPLTVVQDFSVSSATPSQTVTAGQTTGAYQLTIAPNPPGSSFAAAVTLSCPSGLPAAAQCSFSPSGPVTPGNVARPVVMNISTTSAIPAGNYPVTVTGTSGSLKHSVPVALVVQGTNSFKLAVSQAFPSNADAGAQTAAEVRLTSTYTGSVNAACDASAFSGQCSVTPANPVTIKAGVPTTLTITVNVPSSASPNPSNTYNVNLTVSDSSSQSSQQLTLPLTVIQDFSVNSTTPSQTVTAGQTSGAYQLAIAPNPLGSSFPGAVTLSCPSGLPTGAHCSFSPSAPIILGTTSRAVVLNISTAGATAGLMLPAHHRSTLYALWLMLPGIVIVWERAERSPRRRQRIACTLIILVLILTLASCGGGSGTGGGGGGSHPATPTIYSVTVTGISGVISHNAPVTLIVQ
jgi:hypothetical protein